jgi:hypothetical protein
MVKAYLCLRIVSEMFLITAAYLSKSEVLPMICLYNIIVQNMLSASWIYDEFLPNATNFNYQKTGRDVNWYIYIPSIDAGFFPVYSTDRLRASSLRENLIIIGFSPKNQ